MTDSPDQGAALPADLSLDPAQITHDALQNIIDAKTMSGELRVQRQVSDQPATAGALWDLPSFFQYLKENTSVVPPFPGADQDGNGWFAQADKAIGGTEGFEGRAYHGVYSPLRKPGDIFVKPGQVTSHTTSEVSIGYGYNLTGNRDSRQVFQKVLGIDSAGYDKIINGQASITPEQGLRLRQYMIYQANAQLDHLIDHKPLTDYQRAALVSMLYNFGYGNFKKTGIPDLVKQGADPQVIAQKIRGASSSQKALQARRNAEANLFLGVKGAAMQVAATTSNYTK
ncbi:hypothetical protein KTE71_13285 [Burkholderia multivorans]|uniref:glycoside hydrolase family protein n=1 Tax=Burkholderia multivorans TaxID=87883 RepID=UPI001B9F33D2|nr:hypothetical protein [Burkholderia multivorans]MBR8020776.1 hypothetical protein [Burkholderia multivorans]MBU9227297.1 hypothetical protein [Burkholderia multivorans]MBU9388492.1 hypothetical protein [Burkholderia multivorans]MDN8031174.1 hypothetical protein [Burkholderia multivorans]HEF4732931.1 hypothetical protein [Burkholderia multivorans]